MEFWCTTLLFTVAMLWGIVKLLRFLNGKQPVYTDQLGLEEMYQYILDEALEDAYEDFFDQQGEEHS